MLLKAQLINEYSSYDSYVGTVGGDRGASALTFSSASRDSTFK